MKKSNICLLVACALLLSSVWSVALATDNEAPILIGQRDIAMVLNSGTHVHEYGYNESQAPFMQKYVSNSTVSHSLYKYYNGVCIHCAKEGTVVVIGDPIAHTLRYTGSNQHIIGESRHKYFYACNVCGYTTYDTMLCPGTGNGDCIIINPGVLGGGVAEVR